MPDQPWHYDNDSAQALIAAISPERFARYQAATGSDVEALQLYAWNTAASTSLYPVLQTLEVTLRNAVHTSMTTAVSPNWFDDDSIMRGGEISAVEDARAWLNENAKPPTPGRVVAELPFGYWVTLFSNKYDQSVWRMGLAGLFPKHLRQRAPIHENLDRLRTLRNRIAHHEPIFQRHLDHDLKRIRQIVGCLDAKVLQWLEHHETASTVLAAKPSEVITF